MCLIVDANVASDFFCNNGAHYRELLEAVARGRCCVYYGGELRREYGKMRTVREKIIGLDRAGRAKLLPDSEVDSLADTIANVCTSDDPHVVALAMITSCRLLCTNDKLLQQDFTNAQLLAKPRGNIYKNSSHHALIKKHCRRC